MILRPFALMESAKSPLAHYATESWVSGFRFRALDVFGETFLLPSLQAHTTQLCQAFLFLSCQEYFPLSLLSLKFVVSGSDIFLLPHS